jgi:hypothetical protein
MLSLLNKSAGEKSSAAQAIPWRPDFRDPSVLPDTKTVRTTFFLNLIAVTLAGGLLIYFVHREMAVGDLRELLADTETRIASTAPSSERAQANFKLFQAEAAKFNQAHAFVREPFRFSRFVLHLGSMMPTGVAVRRIDYRGPVVNVLGSVSGVDAAASDVATKFVKQLQTDPVLAEHFSGIVLTNIGRNTEEASLNLELVFTFKSAKGAAKK